MRVAELDTRVDGRQVYLEPCVHEGAHELRGVRDRDGSAYLRRPAGDPFERRARREREFTVGSSFSANWSSSASAQAAAIVHVRTNAKSRVRFISAFLTEIERWPIIPIRRAGRATCRGLFYSELPVSIAWTDICLVSRRAGP